jgi:hypothetical protein
LSEIYQYVVAHQDELSAIALAVIVVARLVAMLTPSKHDDEVISVIDRVLRRGIEFLSGAGHRNLIK